MLALHPSVLLPIFFCILTFSSWLGYSMQFIFAYFRQLSEDLTYCHTDTRLKQTV